MNHQPSVAVYVSVGDIDPVFGKIERSGGSMAMPKTELPGDMGTIAGFTDPAGNWIGLWAAPEAPAKKASAKKASAPKKTAAKAPAKKAPAKKAAAPKKARRQEKVENPRGERGPPATLSKLTIGSKGPRPPAPCIA